MDKTACQQLRPLILSDNWKLMEDYLAGEKAHLVSRLCNCNETELKDLQGQIKTLDKFLKMKENLKTEMGSRR